MVEHPSTDCVCPVRLVGGLDFTRGKDTFLRENWQLFLWWGVVRLEMEGLELSLE